AGCTRSPERTWTAHLATCPLPAHSRKSRRCGGSWQRRVPHTENFEGTDADEAGIAFPAWGAVRAWVVAAVSNAVIDAQCEPAANDLGLGKVDEGYMDVWTVAFYADFCGNGG